VRRLLSVGAAAVLAAGAAAAAAPARATAPAFAPPSRADDPATAQAAAPSEPAVVVDTHGVRYVAYQPGSQLSVSADGGKTWARSHDVLTKNVSGCTPPADVGDVELAADAAGRVYFADLQAVVGIPTDTGIQALVGTSDDHFKTFATGCASHQVFSVDREWMAAYTPPGASSDTTRVYLTYHDFGPNTMWVNSSKDGGKTWSQPVDVITAPTAELNSFCDTVPAGVAVDPRNGWVYAAWTAGSSGPTNVATGCNYTQGTVFNHFFVAVSKDEGATWTATDAFAGPAVTDPEPADMSEIFGSIAVDRAGGVHIAFPDYLNGEFGAYTASSPAADSAGALHFTAPAKVNGSDVHTAYFTRLVAGDAGRVDLIYLGSPVKNVTATPANKAAYTGADPSQPNCTPEVGTGLHGVRFPGKPCQMPDSAPWYLYFAQTLDNGATWTSQKVRTDAVHTGDICTLGIFCLPGDDRDLADTYDVKIDATGAAQLAYTYEPADRSRTEIDFQCQTDGPGLLSGVAVRSCLTASAASTPGNGVAATTPAGSNGHLPATGADLRLAWLAAALAAGALALRRRFSSR